MRNVVAAAALLAAAGTSAAPVPEEILRSSLALLQGAQRISVRVSTTSDEVVTTGQKLQRSSDAVIKLRRPDGLRIETTADRYRRTIQYDGKTLVLFDPDNKFYGTFAAPNTVDATATEVRTKLGIDLPLSQLLADDAVTALGGQKRTGVYVGMHRINGTSCHHLAFSQDNVDWQIWIAADGSPLPRKVVIDFKNRPGRPQYTAQLSDWNLQAKLADSDFRFKAPAGSEKIEFLPVEGSGR
jgi:hypothetical protein